MQNETPQALTQRNKTEITNTTKSLKICDQLPGPRLGPSAAI